MLQYSFLSKGLRASYATGPRNRCIFVPNGVARVAETTIISENARVVRARVVMKIQWVPEAEVDPGVTINRTISLPAYAILKVVV